MNEVLFHGLGVPGQVTVSPKTSFYEEEFAEPMLTMIRKEQTRCWMRWAWTKETPPAIAAPGWRKAQCDFRIW